MAGSWCYKSHFLKSSPILQLLPIRLWVGAPLGADAFQYFSAKLQPDHAHPHPFNIIQINAIQSNLT